MTYLLSMLAGGCGDSMTSTCDGGEYLATVCTSMFSFGSKCSLDGTSGFDVGMLGISIDPTAGSLIDAACPDVDPEGCCLDGSDSVFTFNFESDSNSDLISCLLAFPSLAFGGSCSSCPPSSSKLLIDASMISTDSLMSINGGGSLEGGGGGVSDKSESRLVFDSELPSVCSECFRLFLTSTGASSSGACGATPSRSLVSPNIGGGSGE